MVKLTAWLYVKDTQTCCGFSESKEPEPRPADRTASSKNKNEVGRQGAANAESLSLDESLRSSLPVVLAPKDAAAAPRLTLEIVESPFLPIGKKIAITGLGLEGSTRGKSDGHTYVGSVLAEPSGEVINDLVLSQEEGIGRRHFVIKYSPAETKYFLRDLGEGSGTFARVQGAIVIKQGYIVSFSDSHMLMQLDPQAPTELGIRFIEGPKANQVYNFTPASSPVRVGRMVDCGVRFDETSLSRYQCLVSYVGGRWQLEDGDGQKGSTNGTWLYVDDYFEVTDGMVLKAGQSLFSVSARQCKLEPKTYP
jgi:pSer/pThr/pTyr-binding forkhead associated (FHA) protein